ELKIMAMEAEYEKQKLEEAAAAKTRFFANMSHEIRTPMNAILGMSEILLNEPLSDRQSKYVKDIKISSESLLDIVNDILDLSRLESGKLPLVNVHYDFREMIENIYSLCLFLAQDKRLDFKLQTKGEIPQYLYGDDVRLRQVLVNLLSNAIKFTEHGGVVFTIINEGDWLRFDVADTGIGIHEEDMQYLFQPFRQIDNQKNRRIKGTGLGLSICLNLVDLMGGTISVDSIYGKGSTFMMRIPLVPGDKQEIESRANDLPTRYNHAAQVLVVDDSEINLHVAVGLLKMFGISADTANSGAEAIDRLATIHYHLIFMDHMMPDMDGVETTRQIRALGGRFAEVPIVALTANAVIGAREMFLKSGMNDFLAKPIEKIKLQAILAKWMPKWTRDEEAVPRESESTTISDTTRIMRRNTRSVTSFIRASGVAPKSQPESDADSGMTPRLRQVSLLSEIDVELGLSRVMEQQDLFEKLLWMLCETTPSFIEKANAALAGQNATLLSTEAHGMKGALRNVGVMGLAGQAAELEKAAKDGDFTQSAALLSELTQNLGQFVDKLKSLLQDFAETPKEEKGDTEELHASLHSLRQALSEYDYETSLKLITNLVKKDFGEKDNHALYELRRCIEHFNYDDALATLSKHFG
ncbi:MAG: response regulator, partial [Planctomycetes bacterium]|nr:response regulator [Planctomycetota bacterium]